jgi:hypothetical protein
MPTQQNTTGVFKQPQQKKTYTDNPVTTGTCVTLETYLTMVTTKPMVMLGTMTATITKVNYYNHT